MRILYFFLKLVIFFIGFWEFVRFYVYLNIVGDYNTSIIVVPIQYLFIALATNLIFDFMLMIFTKKHRGSINEFIKEKKIKVSYCIYSKKKIFNFYLLNVNNQKKIFGFEDKKLVNSEIKYYNHLDFWDGDKSLKVYDKEAIKGRVLVILILLALPVIIKYIGLLLRIT